MFVCKVLCDAAFVLVCVRCCGCVFYGLFVVDFVMLYGLYFMFVCASVCIVCGLAVVYCVM